MNSEYFSGLPLHQLFHCNGNDYVKQSTRTARMSTNGLVYYFGAADRCHRFAW